MSAISKDTALKLVAVQRKLFEGGIPAIVLMEGDKGPIMDRLVAETMAALEPRGVEYHHFRPEKSRESPFTAMKYIASSPAEGRLAFFDRGWYSDFLDCLHRKGCDKDEKLQEILRMERYMIENGIVVVKIFMEMTKEALKEYGDTYPNVQGKDCGHLDADSHNGDFDIEDEDLKEMMRASDTPNAPWDIIGIEDFESTAENVARVIMGRLEHRLQYGALPEACPIIEQYRNPREDADLALECKGYGQGLAERQRRLAELQCKLAKSKYSMVVVMEGWDAAGKGSAIKRVTHALNPRGYAVMPTKAPTDEELAHVYVWRFCRNLPKRGHIAIFDRSWYGRMMVEPIEGFCTEEEYCRAADELNMFEKALVNSEAILVKIWMEISPEEQLERFNARADDPMKTWKITEEDWRNRSKWDIYDRYVTSMMKQTSTPWAPWTVVESEDKKYGRIKVLDTLIEALERKLD